VAGRFSFPNFIEGISTVISLRDVFEWRASVFDADLVWNQEQDCVLNALDNTGEIISIVFGEREAAVSMAALRAILSGKPCDLQALQAGEGLVLDWRKVDFCAESLWNWPFFFEEVRALFGFAELGIFAPWDDLGRDSIREPMARLIALSEDLPAWIQSMSDRIGRIAELAPEPGNLAIYHYLMRARYKALARLKFDEGAQLTADELAILSDVTTKRVQNASYEKTAGSPVIDKNGLVTRDSTREWLTRKNYRFSIWQAVAPLLRDGPDWGRDVPAAPEDIVNDGLEDEDEQEEEFVFVPVAADQSRFWPNLLRNGKYTIGAKGREEPESDYFKALERLARMPTPHWRRPNEGGNWGIVAGRSWERVRRRMLETELPKARDAGE
jgi:hypothetical protein